MLTLLFGLLIAFSVNVVVIAITGGYRIELGPIHQTAYGLYKPMLLVEGVFFLLVLFRSRGGGPEATGTSPASEPGRFPSLYFWLLLIGVGILYLPTLSVNFQHHDWTHRHISAGMTMAEVPNLFLTPRADRFYRPLTFLFLWADYLMFGPRLWGYHLQSIALHLVNCVLVYYVSVRLGFRSSVSLCAAALFGTAAVNFEAVLWPAARFDLLAATFTLLAVLCYLRYWQQKPARLRYALLSAGCFAAGVLNKETAYCFPLLAAFLLITHRLWCIDGLSRRKIGAMAALILLSMALLVLVRLLVLGGVGGYVNTSGQSTHLFVTAKSIYSLVVNAATLPIFAVNTTVYGSAGRDILFILLGCVLPFAAWLFRGGAGSKGPALAGLLLLSAVPAVNVIGWIQPSLQNCRHLYLPCVWMCILLAATLDRGVWRPVPVIAIVALNCAGLTYNIWVYRDMFQRAEWLAEQVHRDWMKERPVREIRLAGVPESANGVFYFSSELVDRIGWKIPGVPVRSSSIAAEGALCYRWNPLRRTLERVGSSEVAPRTAKCIQRRGAEVTQRAAEKFIYSLSLRIKDSAALRVISASLR